MEEAEKSEIDRRIRSSMDNIVPLRGKPSNPGNPGSKHGDRLVCPPDDAGIQRLLKYCCERVASIYDRWERNMG